MNTRHNEVSTGRVLCVDGGFAITRDRGDGVYLLAWQYPVIGTKNQRAIPAAEVRLRFSVAEMIGSDGAVPRILELFDGVELVRTVTDPLTEPVHPGWYRPISASPEGSARHGK